ncbi:MAG: ATP-binding protein [Granulosicoccus sp.]
MNGLETAALSSNVHAIEQVRLLLVDDDEDFRALCARFLKRASALKGVSVQLAETAREAIDMYRMHDYDCLVVDYRLPDSTGTEMLSALQEEHGNETPASIVLTAGGGEEAAIQAIRVDAADFIPKSEVTRTSLGRAIANAIVKSRLQRSVTHQNTELRHAYGTLQQKTEEIKQFYHNVSHEVKTPLTAIREFQQLLHDEICGQLSTEQKSLINYSLESCDQITLLFNDLLDVTRMESGKFSIDPKFQSPIPLIDQCISAIEPQATRKRINVNNLVASDLPDLYIDKNRFVQILANLLSNALKFTDCDGTITVESQCHPNEFALTVCDTGCGISSSSIVRIFDRLYQEKQGQNLEASSAGLGLGLSIARDIAQKHGGDIAVSSEVGQGSQFTLTIPNFPAEQQANAE